MSLTTVVKRGTAMPDSDQSENNRLVAKVCSGWVLSSITVSANATAVSFVAANTIINGKMVTVAAGTQALTGTLAASTTGAYILTASGPATLRSYVCAGAASIGAIALVAVSSNAELPLGMIVIACTATAFNGGTNSLADSSYAVSFINFAGPAGLAISTELYTLAPG